MSIEARRGARKLTGWMAALSVLALVWVVVDSTLLPAVVFGMALSVVLATCLALVVDMRERRAVPVHVSRA